MKYFILGLLVLGVEANAQIPGVRMASNSYTEVTSEGDIAFKENGCMTFTENNSDKEILDQLKPYVNLYGRGYLCKSILQEVKDNKGSFKVFASVGKMQSFVDHLFQSGFYAPGVMTKGEIEFVITSEKEVKDVKFTKY
jgi:hypothetical protein